MLDAGPALTYYLHPTLSALLQGLGLGRRKEGGMP